MNRLIIALAAILLLVGLAILGPRACSRAQREAGIAKAERARAEGQVGAATDATGITINAMEATAEIDTLTRSNEDAIRSSGGDPAAARRALCLRTAYRDQPGCVALLGPRPGTAR